MKVVILIALSIIMFSTGFSQSGWQIQNSNYTYDINDIVVVNDTAAICVGGSTGIGHFLQTINSGDNWASQAVSTAALNAIAYTSSGVLGSR